MSDAQEKKGAIGTYRVLRELGRRTQRAYAAVRSDDRHALVVIHRFTRGPQEDAERVSPEAMGILLRDARCLAKHWHPNIARVRHVDLTGDTLCIATDFIDGVTLEDLLALARERANPGEIGVSPAVLTRIFLDVLSGLQALHGLRDDIHAPLNAVHGELCPANVVIGKDGVARVVDVFRPRPVKIGTSSGAVGYASPEVLSGEVDRDGRVDVYAVGVMLWETLMNRRLYEETDPGRVAQRQREEDVVRPEAPLADAAMMALSFDPLLRYRSAQEMITSIRGLTDTIAPGSAVAQVVVDLAGERIRTRRAELQAPTRSGERHAIREEPPTARTSTLPRASVQPSSVSEAVPSGGADSLLSFEKLAPILDRPPPSAPPIADETAAPVAAAPGPSQPPARSRPSRVPLDSEPDLETSYAPRPMPAHALAEAQTPSSTPPRSAPKHAVPPPPVTRTSLAPSAVADTDASSNEDDELPGPRSSTPEDDHLAALTTDAQRKSSAASNGEEEDLIDDPEPLAELSANEGSARAPRGSPSSTPDVIAQQALRASSSSVDTMRPSLEPVPSVAPVTAADVPPSIPPTGQPLAVDLREIVASSATLDARHPLLPIIAGIAAVSIGLVLVSIAIMSTRSAATVEPPSTAVMPPAPAESLPAIRAVPPTPSSSASSRPASP
jgi:serine/threonine-protein kinase